jgi:uncharacterized membrane protein HdeD (DUF308 family)
MHGVTAAVAVTAPKKGAHRSIPARTTTRSKTMEPILMMQTAVVLLALAALGGITMAAIRFSGKPYPSTWLAMLHGFLAGAAVTLLLYAAFTVGLPSLATVALVLFLVAAAGGAFMNLNFHWKQMPLPKWLIVVHAGIAVVGFILLCIAAFSTHS